MDVSAGSAHSITSSLFADHDLDTATLMAYLMSQQPGP
jgi:hypothetical protein